MVSIMSETRDSKSWTRLFERRLAELTALKSLVEITVYGSYHPKSSLHLLRSLQRSLVQAGYVRSRLVVDFPIDTRVDHQEITKTLLEFSDANFFVITHKTKSMAVEAELSYALMSPTMVGRRDTVVIFDQLRNGASASSALVADTLQSGNVRVVPFEGTADLVRSGIAVAWDILHVKWAILEGRARSR
jgi:hypothetical protein